METYASIPAQKFEIEGGMPTCKIDVKLDEGEEIKIGKLKEKLKVWSTPGHTPGHVSVVIESGGERGVISGDVLHSPLQLIDPAWGALPDWNANDAGHTRADFVGGLADSATLLIGTHFPAPTAGYVVRVASGEQAALPSTSTTSAAASARRFTNRRPPGRPAPPSATRILPAAPAPRPARSPPAESHVPA